MVEYTCKGPRLAPDNPQRGGCGERLTDLILSLPAGRICAIKCPKCGTEITAWRSKSDGD